MYIYIYVCLYNKHIIYNIHYMYIYVYTLFICMHTIWSTWLKNVINNYIYVSYVICIIIDNSCSAS